MYRAYIIDMRPYYETYGEERHTFGYEAAILMAGRLLERTGAYGPFVVKAFGPDYARINAGLVEVYVEKEL